MAEKTNNSLQIQADTLMKNLQETFDKAPHLPSGFREFLVALAPWAALLFGIIGVVAGLFTFISSLALVLVGFRGIIALITGLLTLLMGVFHLKAYPKLSKHLFDGWKLLYYAELVSILSSVINLVSTSAIVIPVTIIFMVFSAVISFYLLFEIKSYYK